MRDGNYTIYLFNDTPKLANIPRITLASISSFLNMATELTPYFSNCIA